MQDAGLEEVATFILVVFPDERHCRIVLRKLQNGGSAASLWACFAQAGLMYPHGGK